MQGHAAFVAPVYLLCSTGAFVSSTTTFVSFLDQMVYSIISNFIWHAAVHMLHMSNSTAVKPCSLCVARIIHVSPVFEIEGVSGVEKFLLQSDDTATRHSEVTRQAGRQTPPPPILRTYVRPVKSHRFPVSLTDFGNFSRLTAGRHNAHGYL